MHTKILLSVLIILIGLFSCGAIWTIGWDSPSGEEGYITLGTMGTFGSELDDGYWTFSFWIKTTSSDQMALIGCREAAVGEINIRINTGSGGAGGGGYLQAYIADADGQYLRGGVNSDTGVSDGSWHHICVQISCPNDTIRFYVDGVRKTTTYGVQQDADRTLDFAKRSVYLLAYNNNGATANVYEQYSAEFAIFKAELSVQQIQSLASKKRTALQVGSPYAYWRMNEYTEAEDLDGDTIKDFSGNARHGTGVDYYNSGVNILGYTDSFTY